MRMSVFTKLNEVEQALNGIGLTIVKEFTQPKPDTIFPFDFSGEVDELTFGAKEVIASNSFIACLKVMPNDNMFQLLDDKLNAIIDALKNVYDIVKLKKFDYAYYPTQKLVFLYASFEVKWVEQA